MSKPKPPPEPIDLENRGLKQQLREAVEQQSATSEVLSVLGRSKSDREPVFETVVRNARTLCQADTGQIYVFDADVLRLALASGGPSEWRKLLASTPISPGLDTLVGKVALERQTLHIPDVLKDRDYDWQESLNLGGQRTVLGVPMLSDGEVVGTLSLGRTDVDPFTPRQIELVTTFAAQGAIAVHSGTLFGELEAKTGELAQSVEELRALSHVGEAVSSTLEPDEVLQTIVTHAVELSGADGGSIFEFDRETQEFRMSTAYGTSEELMEALRETRIRLDETAVGRAAVLREPLSVPDLSADPGDPHIEQLLRHGWRSMLVVPLLREKRILGALVVRRREPGEFSGETVQLLETFASQSALAIQNAQVFRDVEERSRQVEMELRRFLPSQVVDVIVTSGDESILESHRREITVVFCDLRGFTAFAESVEPEILMDVLHKYHEALGKLIFEFEGTLERFTGDGLMVFFNDPVECDDPALRAVRMAVEMQERVGELALEWKKKGHDLQLGVGIAQGFATAGRIGFEGRSDYAAIGTVTNLSARLCDKAGGGEILVGRRVFATTEEAIEAEPVEPLSLKGFPTPVDAFKVTGLKDVYAGAGRE